MKHTVAPVALEVPESLLRRLDVPGPRYTSYPTADRFSDRVGSGDYLKALQQRSMGSRVGGVTPLSVYVHIPFCESVCYYCACNKVVTKHHDRAAEYIVALKREIELTVSAMGTRQKVTQLHFGGGTPTFLSDEELSDLMATLRQAFKIDEAAEISIEVDPRTASKDRLKVLWTMGFNRISFGIQDFDPDVQKAVHRVQPYESVRDLMLAAREIGFESINADLIYGLPMQTAESFNRTISQVAGLRPDRIALYAYAHLPERFMPQRRIDISQLPTGGSRLQMLSAALSGFVTRGYSYIGMDHFALPNDPLAVAKRLGRLQRNFQGYSTQPDCDLVALGVSAIGRLGGTYVQNAKTLPKYYNALDNGEFPTERGWLATRDDVIRRAVIMAIMCQGHVDFEAIDVAHLICMKDYFAGEIESLKPFVDEGLVSIDDQSIHVTPLGWYFVRGVAMVFDKYLRQTVRAATFSKII